MRVASIDAAIATRCWGRSEVGWREARHLSSGREPLDRRRSEDEGSRVGPVRASASVHDLGGQAKDGVGVGVDSVGKLPKL